MKVIYASQKILLSTDYSSALLVIFYSKTYEMDCSEELKSHECAKRMSEISAPKNNLSSKVLY